MNTDLKEILSKLNKNDEPSDMVYSSFLKKIDFDIDKDFVEFVKSYNGAEGVISENDYIILWNIDDIISLNPYYEGVKECEELFFIGTNGSNLGYAFDKKSGKIVSIDFLDISKDQPYVIADTFLSFLNILANNDNISK